MEVDYGITAGLYWSIILSHCDWQVLTHRRPCWYTQEIRKWKQIRKMPQDSFYPWQIRWPRSMPQHSHVNRIAFTHLSEAAQQSQKNPPQTLLSRCSPTVMVRLGVSSLRLELLRYLSSSENAHIQVKLFAVKKAGGMLYSKDLWRTFSGCAVLEIE